MTLEQDHYPTRQRGPWKWRPATATQTICSLTLRVTNGTVPGKRDKAGRTRFSCSSLCLPTLLLSGLLVGCGDNRGKDIDVTRAAMLSNDAPLDRVTAGSPKRKTLELYTTQPATIRAFEEAALYTRASGYVSKVNVDIGDRVQAGQVLIEIDAPELHDDVRRHEALVAQAEAQLSQAEAAIVAAEAATRTAQARRVGVEAGLARAAADQQLRKAEYDRIRDLAGRGAVSEKLVDESRNQFRAAEAALAEAEAAIESARAVVEEAEANRRKAESDRIAAEANVQVAAAERERTRTMADFTKVAAPFDGVITRRKVDTGHLVYATAEARQPLLVVAHDDVVRVVVDVPETEAEWVTAGGDEADPAVITIEGIEGRSFTGRVARTAWSLDPSSRSLRTEIDIANDERSLRAGMYATARIRLQRREDVVALPVTAIVDGDEGPRCCVVVDGKIEFRSVELGLRSGGEVEIVSGISETDIVVLARAAALADGQPVEVITAET